MMNAVLQYGLYLVILMVLAIPLGKYISKVMDGEKVFLSKVLVPVENFIYKIMRIDKKEDMTWKKYAVSVVSFSIFGFIILFLLNMLQGVLPLNPEGVDGTTAHLAFNTTSSFVTNTNWQAYSGESGLSYLTQMLGLTVQNFVSAATGIAVLFALIRGFTRVKEKGIGSFWVDLTRSILYVLIPLSIVVTLGLASQGVVQNLNSYEEVQLVQPIELEDGTVITKQVIPQGPAASQIAIKQLGTNGGGFFGVNSAHPLENPTIFSNMLEMISLLLIPAALCFSFGRSIKDKKQGRAIFLAMFIMLVAALSIVAVSEANATPQLAQSGMVDVSTVGQAGGNMEGKESRFGIVTSSTWATFTTAASNGSVNSMHDSYTPLGGMITMLQMQLGEVIFGGVGCGLYGMLAFAIVAVFIAGLMVGRTPEYLGKKIEPYEMKMAMLVCLATPIAILVSSGIASLIPEVAESLNNGGAHGFSEMLYAYSSAGGNNGSAFAGFGANTPFINITIGIVMLFARFVPLIGTLAIAGSLVQKKKVAVSVGTLSTHNALFIGLLIFVVLLVGALSFFPALALGPIAEFFQMIA
ncbi:MULTISPECIES: potassium-transporting ATPase subunit KdpA [Clostridium]|uniref:potassium-transporting ATPase subunit KdpA n=2 Tax=Bacillota TaxID=1239 RepID=UPI000668AE3F|nr:MULTISPECIES: potassium-transporting ATPase subunit KdpA [Clostridium]MBS7130255.1 potassium-transporting ATPase subunit KdpA [Clostridium sp.]MDB2075473.1 potassium-transporting ATPase subunit KdpA [Clostridium paraputrificum]MDB2079037.1 potassium-transporting ATPase subunit KdpA [Clostridium paraputrificum]MDB2093069.1 potassium-transporting ATPase subunit KdpA [Clostridium paraputrificum]MDB2099047.1 potassium-transporting ATPase subunit KdpA [Clostridium paraputrificum]